MNKINEIKYEYEWTHTHTRWYWSNKAFQEINLIVWISQDDGILFVLAGAARQAHSITAFAFSSFLFIGNDSPVRKISRFLVVSVK